MRRVGGEAVKVTMSLVGGIVGFVVGAMIFLVADIVDVTTAMRHITVTTKTGEVVACHNITIDTPVRIASGEVVFEGGSVMCADALKDGGFHYRGWTMREVKEIRAR